VAHSVVAFDSVDNAIELVSMKAAGRTGIAGKRKRACADHEHERARKSAARSAAEIAARSVEMSAEVVAEEIAGEVEEAGEVAEKEFHF